MTDGRRPVIAANWKMHHDHLVAIQVVQKLSYRLEKEDYEDCDVVVCPPFTDLRTLQTLLEAGKFGDLDEDTARGILAEVKALAEGPAAEAFAEASPGLGCDRDQPRAHNPIRSWRRGGPGRLLRGRSGSCRSRCPTRSRRLSSASA